MNLYKETIDALEQNNKKIEDIDFIEINFNDDWCFDTKGTIEIDINNFLEVAKNTNYDNGYGGNEIPLGLKIVGKNWWLERGEYDGSEWFEFKTLPIKPTKKEKITTIKVDELREIFEEE